MRRSSEKGATLVHVSVMLVGLIVFSGLVIDYGSYWVTRRQAQNAADAGALSGALSRIHEDSSPSPSTTSGKVHDSIVNTVALNPIWGQAPDPATVDIGWNCPDGTTNCSRVDVFRDGTHSSTALPTFFLRIANLQSQKVRAHAVAQIIPANGTGCMRPWFVPNTFTDGNGNGVYDNADIGTPVEFHENATPSGYGQLDVGSGGNAIRDAIRECVSGGPYVVTEPPTAYPTKPGGTVGPEKQGIDSLIAWDSNAWYQVDTDSSTGKKTVTINDSCAPNCQCPGYTCPYGGSQSPRIVDVPICTIGPSDPDCMLGGPNNGSIKITDFLSFFILNPGYSGNGNNLTIHAVLIGHAGEKFKYGGTSTAAFLQTVVLVR